MVENLVVFRPLSVFVGCLVLSLVNCLSPISIKGTKLYDDDGNQFFVKGIAYARGVNNTDVLVDTAQCQVDAGLMKTLGANTARVFSVDNTKNHDGCMQAFASQGIYIWLDLPTTQVPFDRNAPAWTEDLFTYYSATVDAFAGYVNLLSFTIGNEVMTQDVNTTLAAPYLKAAIRDIKAFRDARGYRPIPISYGSDDVARIRQLTAEYFTCGDSDASIDMYGLNVYSWCGNSSYYLSGYDTLYEQFQSIDIPVLFTETGCKEGGRDFSDVSTMLGPVFQSLFSGAIVYEWGMTDSGYGIVNYSDTAYTGFPTTLSDYNALKTVFSTVTPTGTAKAAYTPSNSAPACPTMNSSAWLVDGDPKLPTIAGLELSTVTARTTILSASMTGTNAGIGQTSTGIPSGSGSNVGAAPGLSAGAIAGIAVGGVVLLIAAGLGLFFVVRRRRKTDPNYQAPTKEGTEHVYGDADQDGALHQFKSELPATSTATVIPRQELEAGQFEQGGPANQDAPAGANHTLDNSEARDTAAAARQSTLYELEGN